MSSKSALPVPCPAQGTSYLNGVCRRPCTLSRAASLPEKEKQIQTQPDPVVCGEPGQILPLSKSFLKSRIWRVPEALPQASAEFSVFPSQCGDPCFINAKNQTSTQPAWNGGGDFLCAVGFLTICQCDTVGPHFLPSRGPAPEISLDCVTIIQTLSERGAQAQASSPRGAAAHREMTLSESP